jgi:hypothetical protein
MLKGDWVNRGPGPMNEGALLKGHACQGKSDEGANTQDESDSDDCGDDTARHVIYVERQS